eukprot:Lithocolla_globosa_v1_NODE_1513_length_2520_cov_11.413793.p2 type:complete len:155 gc:universal NODE_1513_length_2520_cov_11.413793:2477-2013(-)
MKFAKYIASESVPEWRSQYINYKRLKKLLKVLVEQQESKSDWGEIAFLEPTAFSEEEEEGLHREREFFKQIKIELEKVNKFFFSKLEGIEESFSSFPQQLKTLSKLKELDPKKYKRSKQTINKAFLSFYRSLIYLLEELSRFKLYWFCQDFEKT